MKISRCGLIISLFLFLCLLIIFFLSFGSSKKILSEIGHLKGQNETIITNMSQQETEIKHLQMSIDKFQIADSISVNEEINIVEPSEQKLMKILLMALQ